MSMFKRRLISIGIVMVFVAMGFAAVPLNVSAETVILHPGYITGTMTITGETVTSGWVDAYSVPPGYDGHDNSPTNGDYFVTVEGDNDYNVFYNPRMTDNTNTEYYIDTYGRIGKLDTYVGIGNTINLDFNLNPGTISPVVTVTGGDIDRMNFWTNTNYVPADSTNYYSYHYQNAKTGYHLTGTTAFPMKPTVTYDANSDGDYNDYTAGDTYLSIYGTVYIGSIGYELPLQYIDLAVATTTYVYWDLDVTPGSISGSMNFVGDDPYYYYVRGDADIGDTHIELNDQNYGTSDYYAEVPATTWVIYPDFFWYDTTTYQQTYLSLRSIPDTVVVPPGVDVDHDFDVTPGYITGSVNLVGANTDLDYAYIYADNPDSSTYPYNAYTRTDGADYELVLHEGDWTVGYPFHMLYFDYPTDPNPDLDSYIRISDYSAFYIDDPIAVTSSGTVTDVDFNYETATITLNYVIEGGGELRSPSIRTTSYEGTYPDYFYTYGYGYGSDALTTIGECTITVLPGTHTVSAYAYVEDSNTKFGEFTIVVEPGDIIEQDIGAPTLIVTSPTGYQEVSDSSVLVEGTATDDSGIATITINGVEVPFVSTNNPEDPNEVSFSVLVEGLVPGENTITVEATDTYDKTASIERTVVYVLDNEPPVADANGPYEADEGETVTLDASGSSDPDGDPLTYRWDLDGDGTWDTPWSSDPTYEYTWPDNYAGTVIVEVSDGEETETDSTTVTISNVPPEVSIDDVIQPIPGFILPGDVLQFEGSFEDPGSDEYTYEWDFGDGGWSSGSLYPDHSYDAPGTYEVTLTVTDDDGGEGTATVTIEVLDAEGAKHVIMDYIENLPDEAFDENPEQHKNALENKFLAVDKQIEHGAYHAASLKLLNDIRSKMDGDPTPNEWIIDPTAQSDLTTMIDALRAYLDSL